MKLKNILLCTVVALVLAPTVLFAGPRFSFSINMMSPPVCAPICPRPVPVYPIYPVPVYPHYYYPYYPRPVMPCPPPPCPWMGVSYGMGAHALIGR